jgi:hypothetical protein
LLLSAYATHAQKSNAEPGLRRLKRNNGLCGIKLGMPKQRMHLCDTVEGYIFRYYDGSGKYRKLGPYRVQVYSYGFTERNGEEVLSTMTLHVSDPADVDKVAQWLQAHYGPHNLGSISQIWKTSTVIMIYRVFRFLGEQPSSSIRIFRDDWNTHYYQRR